MSLEKSKLTRIKIHNGHHMWSEPGINVVIVHNCFSLLLLLPIWHWTLKTMGWPLGDHRTAPSHLVMTGKNLQKHPRPQFLWDLGKSCKVLQFQTNYEFIIISYNLYEFILQWICIHHAMHGLVYCVLCPHESSSHYADICFRLLYLRHLCQAVIAILLREWHLRPIDISV